MVDAMYATQWHNTPMHTYTSKRGNQLFCYFFFSNCPFGAWQTLSRIFRLIGALFLLFEKNLQNGANFVTNLNTIVVKHHTSPFNSNKQTKHSIFAFVYADSNYNNSNNAWPISVKPLANRYVLRHIVCQATSGNVTDDGICDVWNRNWDYQLG